MMLSTAAIGLMLASGLAYAQSPGERKDEPRRTEEPAKGTAQRAQGAAQDRAQGAQERTHDQRAQGAGREEDKGGAKGATERAGAAEHSQQKTNEQTQNAREPSRERNREAEGAKGGESGKSSAESKRENPGTPKSTAESDKSKTGQHNERSGTAANQNEHNQPNRNAAEQQPSTQPGRPATAESTKTNSSNNAQNAPSASGQTNQTNQANTSQANQPNQANNTSRTDQQSRTNPEQRVRISETFSRQHLAAPERDLNISIRVGEAVPPRVSLHRLPPEIISIEPEYRDYDYFTTDDDIVIVEPGTHRIVSEVPRDPSRARAQISGSSSVASAGSGGSVNCKVMRRDANGNVSEVEPSTVGASARTDSLSVTVQIPGGGTSAPIALGAPAGDIMVASQGPGDCTVTLEPQAR